MHLLACLQDVHEAVVTEAVVSEAVVTEAVVTEAMASMSMTDDPEATWLAQKTIWGTWLDKK